MRLMVGRTTLLIAHRPETIRLTEVQTRLTSLKTALAAEDATVSACRDAVSGVIHLVPLTEHGNRWRNRRLLTRPRLARSLRDFRA